MDQAVARLRRDLIRQYPEDEKAIDALIRYFLGEDALDDMIIEFEERKNTLTGGPSTSDKNNRALPF